MKIVVRRFEYSNKYTIGRMYINDKTEQECFTLEDVVRASGVKVFGETAIPAGVYNVTLDFSPHFERTMPHILNVPDFDGVRIHSGNDDADTEGCILVGQTWTGGDFIGSARDAFNHLFPQLQLAFTNKETITIEIVDTK